MNESNETHTCRGGQKLVTAKWLTEHRFCGVKPSAIHYWAKHEVFPAPFAKTGKVKWWLLSDIDEWIEANRLTKEQADRLRAADDVCATLRAIEQEKGIGETTNA